MAAPNKAAQQLARQLFKMSVIDGNVSAAQVEGVLAYLEKHPPAKPLLVLQAYQQYIARELAKSEVVVEHAGPVTEGILRSLEGALSQKYKRQVTATAKQNAKLIAGLRLRIGDDMYETSIAGQLAQLSAV
ncbi:MAG: F0F1 ATP synthase subunit delta [Proteobacteria bacterium]|jgi:F-type H+-transporting ATPase subunit delta|uniref:F0F1 ATP synthase subunit delta n=1 Tax=Cephaloticoccus sp. TaxID=1985742 RepID=UPI00404A0A2A|nr:F0F1 ATP synthase subunit delta [Pseudomonadota bacterium]